MHITAIKLVNFGPFKGPHRIELGPQVYAITAEHDANAERSNWLGKTTLLAAIRFALFGKHHWDSEDAWITDGEAQGVVELELSTGLVATRSRKRGAATQLEVTLHGTGNATQKRAQEVIDLHLGMDYEASRNGPFIEQKQIARLVIATPAERTNIINGWLALGPLQAAADAAKVKLSHLIQQDEGKAALLAGLATLTETLPEDTGPLNDRLAVLAREGAEAEATIAASSDHDLHAKDAARFAEVCAKGGKLAGDIASAAPLVAIAPLAQAATDAAELHREARGTWQDLTAMDRDGFDGQCPILCDACPANDEVAARVGEVTDRLPEAEQEADITQQARDDADAALASSRSAHATIDRAKERMAELREEAKALQVSATYIKEHGAPPDITESLAAWRATTDESAALKARVADAMRLVDVNADRAKEYTDLTAERATLADQIRTAREAVAVLGRGGVQREIAEESMGTIEARANALLAAAGVDLTIQIRWAREGKGLATHCTICGAPYPAGRSVKECPQCAAPRGPKMVEKTHFDISNRSGAADDMAGLAFQLAAASWQREAKGMVWSSVLIDEPFSACDVANAKAMGVHLQSMIRGQYGFEQGFVVAHSAGVTESMPARVVVRSDGTHARLEVM